MQHSTGYKQVSSSPRFKERRHKLPVNGSSVKKFTIFFKQPHLPTSSLKGNILRENTRVNSTLYDSSPYSHTPYDGLHLTSSQNTYFESFFFYEMHLKFSPFYKVRKKNLWLKKLNLQKRLNKDPKEASLTPNS